LKRTPLKRKIYKLKRTPLKRGTSKLKRSPIKKKPTRTKTGFRLVLTPAKYRELVEEVYTRDDFRCRNPRCLTPGFMISAHHRVFRSHGGDDSLENLITLCINCHKAVHGYKLKIISWPYGQTIFEEAAKV
jgi:5-methylcytosine-specific restriction endonuclease McrA